MKYDLVNYLQKRFEQHESQSKMTEFDYGPVITLSREYGCPAKRIAEKLSEKLTQVNKTKGNKQQWKWIGKEILAEAAKELSVDPSKIKYLFNYEQRGFLDDIFASYSSKYYKSSRKVKNTVRDVIRSIGKEGNCIIVGRGGVAITHDIIKSLHVNLEAPLEWRAIRVSERYNISIPKARDYALDIDKKRKAFREQFEGKNTDYTTFDLTLNCMTLTMDEIVDIIVHTAEIRKLI
ncbi:MAG: cytidylate kinase-like family protein [Bacteroidales bacterium]|nr:cytidylate kinase-like family protein [Bacteroidales bacterium]